MIIYLTQNDEPSGIYSSQVIDVVKFLNDELKEPTRLVALISMRGFFVARRQIKSELTTAIVLPMYPGMKRWRANGFILWFIWFLYRPKLIIARSVLATNLALRSKRKGTRVVHDGRGALMAEWYEYDVIPDAGLKADIFELEQTAVCATDYRIAVSQRLVNYWRNEFNYSGSTHVVIPCTLNRLFGNIDLTPATISAGRKLCGFEMDDIVFIYAGSVSGWQGFGLLEGFVRKILTASARHKMFFLSRMENTIGQLQGEFPGQVMCKRVLPAEVPLYLMGADYGLLIREQSTTNQVASPVKFAEYLSCGLKVIISANLGDYSQFVMEHQCGYLCDDFEIPGTVSMHEKAECRRLAMTHFEKINYKQQYQMLVSC